MNHIYNLKKDTADHRDHFLLGPLGDAFNLPKNVDLREKCPPIYDQKNTGSCTGNGIGAILDVLHFAKKKEFFGPSRLFIYWFERFLEGTIDEDAGASIRNGIKVVNKYGACKETTWAYDESKFRDKPSDAAIAEALNYQAISYKRVPLVLFMLKSVLAKGFPIVCGIKVYESL